MCGYGTILAILVLACLVNDIIAFKSSQWIFLKWIHSSDGLNKAVYFLLSEKQTEQNLVYLWKEIQKVWPLDVAFEKCLRKRSSW